MGLVPKKGPVQTASTGPLLALHLDPSGPLGRQLEAELRRLIRDGALAPGDSLPSTRALAADLAVSRGVVVGAYGQLEAEGYLVLRRGASATVASLPPAGRTAHCEQDVPVASARFNLRPDLPDLGLFPRGEWLAATRAALRQAADTDLAYGGAFGSSELRAQLIPFLARTRGTIADPGTLSIHAGSTQALAAITHTLRLHGARTIGCEDPGHRWRHTTVQASGLHVVPVPVDEDGLRVDALGDVDAVVVSPEHSFPLGAALSPVRRRALVAWAVRHERVILEHDYDGHFRYDRAPASALQALAPDHVAYIGTASSLLAPALRLGWMIAPARFAETIAGMTMRMLFAAPRLDQLTLAEFIARGYLDRQLRRARAAYKRRRDLVARALPTTGTAAGLFVHVPLLDGVDEAEVLAGLRAAGFALDGVQANAIAGFAPGLAVGFAAAAEPTLARATELLLTRVTSWAASSRTRRRA